MKISRIGFRALQLVVALSLAVAQFAPLAAVRVQARNPLSAISLKTVYTQNFDTLSNSTIPPTPTWTDDSTLPGWFSARTGTADNKLIVSIGTSSTGGLYSYGSNGATERALGSLASGTSGDIYYGVKFINDANAPIVELKVTYTGEQWRDGAPTPQAPQKLTFYYSTDATAINSTSTWNTVPALDFTSPKYSQPSGTFIALDGNLADNRRTLTASIPVSIPAGSTVWLRWKDTKDPSYNHGLAIDDLSVEAVMGSGDPAPSVLSSTPAANASGVAADAPIQVTFSEPVTVSDGYILSCGGNEIPLTLSGSDDSYTFTPADPMPLATACSFGLPADSVTDLSAGQPMSGDFSLSFNTTSCGAPFTSIHDIQGSGAGSPVAGTTVTLEGVVTADFQTSAEMSGVFLQSAPGEEDNDPATSEGVFVYLKDSTNNVSVGDRLRLTGQVVEYTTGGTTYGQFAAMTEISTPISNVETCASNQPLPDPMSVVLPEDAGWPLGLERFEGMLVSVTSPDDGPLTVQQNYFQARFGQLTLASGGRVFQQNNGTGGSADDVRRMIVLDDHSNGQNLSPIPYYAADGAVRAGDTVTNLVGILDQGRINSSSDKTASTLVFPNVYYRLEPTSSPVFTQTNARSATPPDVLGQDGTTKIASFNVLNYFLTLDNGQNLNTARGADTAAELQRQQDKLVTALSAIHADVFGLMEIEADNTQNAPKALATALNARINNPSTYSYQYVADPADGTGGDVIQTALLYNAVTVTPVGASMTDANTIFDRFPFAQAFEDKASKEQFIVVVNHFKSKGSCPTQGDADYAGNFDKGDGQGCWVAKRVAQAVELLNFIETLKQTDPDVIVIGDLNSYGNEDPIQVLTSGGLVNQVEQNVPADQRYSYVFDGAAGYLDHALTTDSVSSQLTGVAYWHINSDEPSVIDYNQEFKTPPNASGSPDLFNANTPYRASDHDPVLIGLKLIANEPPVLAIPIPDQQAVENQAFSFTLPAGTFTDPTPGDQLSLSADLDDGSPLPDWLSFDGETFSGTPSAADAATLSIIVTATDMGGGFAQDTFVLTVLPNEAPVLKAIGKQTVDELKTLSFALSATDDGLPNGKLTYSMTGAPENATLNPDTGAFSWTPTEAQGAAPFTPYTFTFTVSDGDKSASITVDVEVYEVNNAPVFEDPGPQQIDELTLVPYSLKLSATDDSTAPDKIIFTAVKLPGSASYDEATQTLTWTPTEAEGADGPQGDYQAEFTASDGALSSTLVIKFHVNEINTKPVLNKINSATIDEHNAWTLTPTFSDADLPANTLTFRLGDGAPAGMKVNAATGVVTWTPDETQGRAEGYPVTLYLSDGNSEVSQSFTLTVNETNSDPYFTKLADQTVGPFDTLTFDVSAADDDLPKQALTMAVKQGSLPAGAQFVQDQGKGTFTWKPGPRAAGTYTVTFTVTDGVKLVEKTITITVTKPHAIFLPATVRLP